MRNPIFNGFQSGLDNATAQYNPQPNYGITPLPPITLDPGMGEGPFSEANPQTDSGFISLLQGLKTQNDGEIQRKQTELQATRDKFVTFARQMAMEEFNAPQKQQIGQQEAMTAGILALVAKLAGARDQYIQGGLGGYLEGRETQNVNQYNQDLQASKQDYQQRINGLQTESDIAQMDMKGIQGEIGNLQDYGGKLVGEMGDAYQQDQTTAREDAKIGSREYIAKMQDDTKRYASELMSADKRGKELFDITAAYEGYRKIGFSDQEARQFVSSDPAYKIAQAARQVTLAELDKAKTGDILAFRQPKLKEMAAKLGLIDAQTGAYRALTGVREQQAIKLIASLDEDPILIDEDIKMVEDAFKQYEIEDEKTIVKLELKLKEAQTILSKYSPGNDGYDEAYRNVEQIALSLAMMKRSQKEYEDQKKAAIKAATKGKTSNAPMAVTGVGKNAPPSQRAIK